MSEPFVGEVRAFGFSFAPGGWAFCDGQILQVQQNTALFSILGTTYGGDRNAKTFGIPDLRGTTSGTAPNGVRITSTSYCIALKGVFPAPG